MGAVDISIQGELRIANDGESNLQLITVLFLVNAAGAVLSSISTPHDNGHDIGVAHAGGGVYNFTNFGPCKRMRAVLSEPQFGSLPTFDAANGTAQWSAGAPAVQEWKTIQFLLDVQ